MIKNLVICSFFLISPMFLQAHGGKTPIVLKGIVADDQSGNVIQDAEISIEKNGEIIHSVKTDENGNFNLQYDVTFLRTDKLNVSVYKPGYKLKLLKTLNSEEQEITVKLEKKPRFIPLILPTTPGKPNYQI